MGQGPTSLTPARPDLNLHLSHIYKYPVFSKVACPGARGYDFSTSLEGHDSPRDKHFQRC